MTLGQRNIDKVLTCGGLGQGKEVATEIPAHVYLLHRVLVVRMTKEYLEAAIISEPHLCQIPATHIFTHARRYS